MRDARDVGRLFVARFVRMVAHGAVGVVLALHLAALGLSEARIGLLFALTLVGDTLISLALTTHADRWGRRRTLVLGAVLMAASAAVFAGANEYLVLLVTGTLGVLSPSGHEVGPFLAVEQASLSEITESTERTQTFARYNLTGAVGAAMGSLAAGLVANTLQDRGWPLAASYRPVLVAAAVIGVLLVAVFAGLGASVETPRTAGAPRLGLHRSRRRVFHLSALFCMDAFGGGFVIQSFVAYWFHVRFGASPAMLGGIFFVANLLAALSALAAARLAARIGLVRTMVFTHLPSNVLLALVPFMPTLPLAIGVLLLRFCISQMDVPARQSYTMAVVEPDERSAAAGVTGVARSLGAAISPAFAGLIMGNPALLGAPFVVAGALKAAYDLLLYRGFVSLQAPGEGPGKGEGAPTRN